MANGTGTGTGGFPIDGKYHTYDAGVDDGVASKQSDQDWQGIGLRGQPPEDLPESTKRTLASYLSNATLGKTPDGGSKIPNDYPIDNTSAPVERSLRDKEGHPNGPTQLSQQGTQRFFTQGVGLVETLRSTSSDGDKVVESLGKARLASSPNSDGNGLLKNATANIQPADPRNGPIGPTNLVNGPVKDYTASLLNNRFNRFNPDTRFTRADRAPALELGDPLGGPQFFDKYVPGSSVASTGDKQPNVNYALLSRVGPILSARAGKELNSNNEGSATDLEAILPGSAQAGISRVETAAFEARDVIQKVIAANEPIDENYLINPTGLSWGALNNTLDQFSGISSFGMMILSIVLVAALVVAFSVLTALLFAIPAVDKTAPSRDRLGRLSLGASQPIGNTSLSGILKSALSGNFSLWSIFGVTKTVHPVGDCLSTGTLAFFGLDLGLLNTDISAGSAVLQALGVVESAGYNIVVARTIARSLLSLGDSFKSVGTAFSLGGNAGNKGLSGVKQLFNTIEALRNSKFIAAINVFAKLGDDVISDGKTLASQKDEAAKGIGTRVSAIDNSPARDAHTKSRIKDGGLRLAWSSYRAEDAFIMPAVIQNASVADGSETGGSLGVPTFAATESSAFIKGGSPYVPTEGLSRITDEQREEIEARFDAEYLPFYFHDLRTNEIVGLHAFLTKLSDSFTAQYDSSDGFGRVEPIKTYKNTQRKLSFSFIIAALSQQDFDSMWLKINKLTTLLYPQYTEGKRVKTENYNFTMPFSQVIAASPMIRLRIGDVVRSNYSKFALARLFGYGAAGTKFGSRAAAAELTDNNEFSKLIGEGDGAGDFYEKQYQAALKLSKSRFLIPPGCQIVKETSSSWPPAIFKPSKDVLRSYNLDDYGDLSGLYLKPIAEKAGVEKDIDGVKYNLFEIGYDDDKDRVAGGPIKRRFVDYPVENIVGKVVRIPESDGSDLNVPRLVPTHDTKKAILNSAKTSFSGGNYVDNIKEMMKEDKNVIVKSFRTSGGQGLAGFIESMNFEWLDKTTWAGVGETDGVGRQAPKMCVVDVSFTPIHDISPGIDHTGFNRAPIYPVGPMYSKK